MPSIATNNMFKCERCEKVFKQKCNLVQHLMTISPCPASDSDRTRKDILLELTPSDKKYECSHCNKCFSQSASYSRHKKLCKVNAVQQEVAELREQLKKVMSPTIGETQNVASVSDVSGSSNQINCPNGSMVVNNTVNNITTVLLPFGKENTRYLEKSKFATQCLGRTDKGVIEYIGRKHFDAAHPENHNVRLTNMKQPFMKVHGEDGWELRRKSEVVDEMLDVCLNAMEDHHANIIDDISKLFRTRIVRDIKQFVDVLNDSGKREKLIKKLMLDVELMLHNKTSQQKP